MSPEVRIIRIIEIALAVGLVVLVWNLTPAHIFNLKMTEFTDWWASNVETLFSVEVKEVVDGAPGPGSTPDRIDFAVPTDSGPFAGTSPAPLDDTDSAIS